MVSSITNNLGFGISKYYEDYRNLIIGVSNYFGANNISSFIYENDAIGRRAERLDFDENLFAKTNSFSYNNYSELAEATMNTNDYNFTMDDIGDRTEHLINDIDARYENIDDSNNRYSDTYSTNLVYNQNFAFDLDGNMISITQYDLNDANSWLAWQYTWNAENRMVSATNCVDGTYVTYKYDYQGRMFEKTTNGDTTRFIWNGNHIISEITDSSTNLYVWSNGELLCANLDGETVFYCHDANKNVTDLANTSGDSVAHYEYSPFGVITEQTGALAAANPFRFSNEYFDETTGFVEFVFRPYIPPLAKFASRDPIEEQGGLNIYGIGGNDLINKVDMWGLKEYDFSIYLGVGIAGNNQVITKAGQLIKNQKKTYKPPEDACNDCRLTIVDRVTSAALREASKEYDIIHFFGHGIPDNKIDPDNKNRWIKRTRLAFADGNINLSDVFTFEAGLVQTEYMKPWVCYDKYVDLENKSGIKIIPPMNNPRPNSSSLMLFKLRQEILAKLKEKKCCELK